MVKRAYRRITKDRKKKGARLRRLLDAQFSVAPSKVHERRGQPTKYRPGFCELATRHCMLGATNEELGELFGVTKETVQDWMRTKKEFKRAVYEGRDGADAKVAEALFQRARGMSLPDDVVHFDSDAKKFRVHKARKHLPPDPGAAKFILANRRAVKARDQAQGNVWADKVEHQGPGGGPIDIAVSFVPAGVKVKE